MDNVHVAPGETGTRLDTAPSDFQTIWDGLSKPAISGLGERLKNIAADTGTILAESQLPKVSLLNIEDKTSGGFVRGLTQGFAYSLVQTPLEGAAQTFDHTIGSAFGTNLSDKAKDLIVAAPEPATFGSAEWHGQSIGGALGMTPWFLATRSALRSSAGMCAATKNLLVTEADAALSGKVLSVGGLKSVFESGVTAATYTEALKPVSKTDKPFWTARTEAAVNDLYSFGTLTAGTIYFGGKLGAVAKPLIEANPNLAHAIKWGTQILAGDLAAVPAAAVETAGHYLIGPDKPKSFMEDFAKSAYSYAAVGTAMGAGHPMMAAARGGAGKLVYTEAIHKLDPATFYNLDTAQSNYVLERPDLHDWLSKQDRDKVANPDYIIQNWDSVPAKFRGLDPASITAVINELGTMSGEDWLRIKPENARAVAETITHLNLQSDQTYLLANSQDFANWYRDNGHQGKLSQRHARTILEVWPLLTDSERNQTANKVAISAQSVAGEFNLARIMGVEPNTVLYLRSIATKNVNPAQEAASWLESVQRFGELDLDKAKATVWRLIEQKAPAQAFTIKGLYNEHYLDLFYGNDPASREKLVKTIDDTDSLHTLLWKVSSDPDKVKPVVEIAMEHGFPGSDPDWATFDAVSDLNKTLALDSKGLNFIYNLSGQGLRLTELNGYASHDSSHARKLKALINSEATVTELNSRHLSDKSYIDRLTDFSEDERDYLGILQANGLMASRLYNHLLEKPEQLPTIKELIARNAGVREIDDFMRLSVYPQEVTLPLIDAVNQGKITTEDVLAKTKDWQSGRYFYDLLAEHVKQDLPLSRTDLESLHSRAQNMATEARALPPLSPDQNALMHEVEAAAFVDAVKGIEAIVPADKPIVLLGRDAWPLLPMLRLAGRDVRYFLWSRLQNDDVQTHTQWLKEIPPNAAVIDTGYAGNIIDAISLIDRGVTGYLMSSSRQAKYPQLLSGDESTISVGMIESRAKLIYRTQGHNAKGGAISRPNKVGTDIDTLNGWDVGNRWDTEHSNRILLRASGLPVWDAWRYSQFTGLSAKERLGFQSNEQLEQYYHSVQEARQAAKARQEAEASKRLAEETAEKGAGEPAEKGAGLAAPQTLAYAH